MKPAPSARRRADVRPDRGMLAARAVVVVGLAASVGLLIAGDGGDAAFARARDAASPLMCDGRGGLGFVSAAL